MYFFAHALASLLSWIWWFIIPVRKQTAITAFQTHFPTEDPTVLREMMSCIVLQYLHIILGYKASLDLIDPPTSGICICAHGMGWDISMLTFGPVFPLTVYFKRPSGRIAAWLIERARHHAKIEGIYKGQSMDRAHHAIESGRLVCFVVDQRYNRGIKTNFFGQTCLSSPAFAALYWTHKPPLYTAWPSYSNGRFQLHFKRFNIPNYQNRNECVPHLTQLGQDWVESCIRQNPPHWLWLHKRWKTPQKR